MGFAPAAGGGVGGRCASNCEGCITVRASNDSSLSSPPSEAGSTTEMPPTMVFWNCAATPGEGFGAAAGAPPNPSLVEVMSIVPLNLGAGLPTAGPPAPRGAEQRWQFAAFSGF